MSKNESLKIELTTDSPASSYGISVARIDGVDYGPGDRVPLGKNALGTRLAASLVYEWAQEPGRTPEEREAARRFLRQWPDERVSPETCAGQEEAVAPEVSTYTDSQGQRHEAVILLWEDVAAILGHAHRGIPEDDQALIAYLRSHGAPAWVQDAEGWIDPNGWGLIGPETVEGSAEKR